jgi:hypothetical protein
VFFLIKGMAAYVLPRFQNKAYFEINEGESFGLLDLGELYTNPEKYRKRHFMRQFTVQSFDNCEVVTLPLKEVFKMRLEFP